MFQQSYFVCLSILWPTRARTAWNVLSRRGLAQLEMETRLNPMRSMRREWNGTATTASLLCLAELSGELYPYPYPYFWGGLHSCLYPMYYSVTHVPLPPLLSPVLWCGAVRCGPALVYIATYGDCRRGRCYFSSVFIEKYQYDCVVWSYKSVVVCSVVAPPQNK